LKKAKGISAESQVNIPRLRWAINKLAAAAPYAVKVICGVFFEVLTLDFMK